MHCALEGTHSDLRKVSELGDFCSSDKLLQLDDPKSSSGDFQISSLSLGYVDHRIQELVRCDVPPSCKMYGDPSILNSTNLADLHPKSWYSVAWYPIYRIPDGRLRAAFLTYHSLGHLVRRTTKVDHSNENSCIICPVGGLQSYNAQGECWFQLRCSTVSPKAQSEGLNPSGILKERLRTLEETASVMARAVVNKGNQKSVNRHPDYEYFVSRRC